MATKISVASVIPEHQLILAESSKLLASFTDVSKYATSKGVNQINYPTMAARVAQSLAIDGTITNVNANYADEILNLSIKLADAFNINVHVEQQNVLNAMEDSMKEILRAFGLQADKEAYDALIAELQTAGENVEKTSDMYADLVAIQKKLNDNKVPMADRYLAVNTTDWATLLKTKDFVQFQSTGNGQPIVDGVVGRILGFQVILSTVVSGDSVAYHSKALAYAFSGSPILMEADSPLSTSTQYSVSEMLGVKATQGGKFAVRYGANPA